MTAIQIHYRRGLRFQAGHMTLRREPLGKMQERREDQRPMRSESFDAAQIEDDRHRRSSGLACFEPTTQFSQVFLRQNRPYGKNRQPGRPGDKLPSFE